MVICMLLKTYIFARDGLEAFSCTNENVVKVLKFIAILFNIAKILVPIILIVTGVISIAKAVVSDERDFSKEITSLVIKLFVGLFVFLLPTILLAFIDLIDGSEDVRSDFAKCSECILDYSRCPGVSSNNSNKNNSTKNNGKKNDNSTITINP